MTSVIEVIGGDPQGTRFVVLVSHKPVNNLTASRFAVKAHNMATAAELAENWIRQDFERTKVYPGGQVEQITRLGT